MIDDNDGKRFKAFWTFEKAFRSPNEELKVSMQLSEVAQWKLRFCGFCEFGFRIFESNIEIFKRNEF